MLRKRRDVTAAATKGQPPRHPRQLREPLAARRIRRLGAHHARHGCHPHAAVPARKFPRFHIRAWPPSAKPRDMRLIQDRPSNRQSIGIGKLAEPVGMPTGRNTTSLAPQSEEAGPQQLRGAIGRAPPPCSARRRKPHRSCRAVGRARPHKTRRNRKKRRAVGRCAPWKRAPAQTPGPKSEEGRQSGPVPSNCNGQRTNFRALNSQDSARQSERRPP